MPRPRLPSRSAALVLAAASVAACVPLPGNRTVSRQWVARKEAENTLVSNSGATCRVKDDVYAKVNVGDEHTCVWKYASTNDAPAAGSPTSPVQDQAPRRAPGRPGGP